MRRLGRDGEGAPPGHARRSFGARAAPGRGSARRAAPGPERRVRLPIRRPTGRRLRRRSRRLRLRPLRITDHRRARAGPRRDRRDGRGGVFHERNGRDSGVRRCVRRRERRPGRCPTGHLRPGPRVIRTLDPRARREDRLRRRDRPRRGGTRAPGFAGVAGGIAGGIASDTALRRGDGQSAASHHRHRGAGASCEVQGREPGGRRHVHLSRAHAPDGPRR